MGHTEIRKDRNRSQAVTMDTLTHALSGALLARATAPAAPRPDQLTHSGRMGVGFVAAAFPDSDFITRWIDPLTYLTTHRGITHSILMLPLWALALAFLFMWLSRGKRNWRAFAGVCALGIGIHIVGDVITAFGTMVLAPLSELRVSLPTTFIIDPYFTAILAAGLIASHLWKQTRAPAVAGLALLATFVGFQALLHQQALALARNYVQTRGLDAAAIHALPQPLSPFNWMLVVNRAERYDIAYISLWRREVPDTPAPDAGLLAKIDASYYPATEARWVGIPKFGTTAVEDRLAREAWGQDSLAAFRRFTLFPALHRIDNGKQDTCVWFNDLRFATGGRMAPFLFGLCRADHAAPWRLYRLLGDGGRQAIFQTLTEQG